MRATASRPTKPQPPGRPDGKLRAAVLALFVAAFVLAAEASPPPAPAPPELTADFDGDGRAETATVRAQGKSARLEIADANGKRLAAADAPVPGGASALVLQGGPLGSPGVLIEVIAAGPNEECRSFWRFRDGALTRLPARNGKQDLPDCSQPDGWAASWERTAGDAPAVWVRERTRQTPRGAHRERDVYVFSGFTLDCDPARSEASIAGVAIPNWNEGILYTPLAIDTLSSRFDLTRFRAAPRLAIRTDRAKGLFAFVLEDPAGRLEAPVTAAARGGEKNEVVLTLQTETGKASARVTVRGSIVSEAVVAGLAPRWDGAYQPTSRFTGGALEVYARAEDEVASNAIVGLWASDHGEQLALNLVPGMLGFLEMRQTQVEVSLDHVPAGSDVLLLPRDGTAPSWALVLKGGNSFDRVPVRCSGRNAGSWSCERAGPTETFHRVGGRMNAR